MTLFFRPITIYTLSTRSFRATSTPADNSYLGEIILQFGPPLIASTVVPGAWKYGVFVSPAFTYLLLRYASGVPPLEKSAEKKYGKEPEWRKYTDNTGVLIPGIGKGKAA
jgi:steroid 5-alpha reductase family enzyme